MYLKKSKCFIVYSPVSTTINTYQIPDFGNYEVLDLASKKHITSKSELKQQNANSYINNSSINVIVQINIFV